MKNDSQGIRAGVGHGHGMPAGEPWRLRRRPLSASAYAIATVALLLSGCAFDNTRMSGGNNAGGSTVQSIPPSQAELDAGDASGSGASTSGSAAQSAASPGADTNTVVGQKVVELRSDLERIKANLAQRKDDLQKVRLKLEQDSFGYYSLLGQINSHLQVGTTPGNPQIQAQWNAAQTQLDHISDDAGQLSKISNEAASDSSFASYLVNATRAAFGLQGAVDEDHRNLSHLETEANATMVGIDALLTSLSDEINRQSAILANEHNNLETLALAIKNGQLYGPSLATRAFNSEANAPAGAPPRRGARSSSMPAEPTGRPLVVIRFDRPNVPYEEALYNAVSQALERRPGARFDIVAVAPGSSNPADAVVGANASKHNAESVRRSLVNMGLPADRLSMSATSSGEVQDGEVRIYVR
jgi:hypothetical protein